MSKAIDQFHIIQGKLDLSTTIKVTCQCSCRHWVIIESNPGALRFRVPITIVGDVINVEAPCPNCRHDTPFGDYMFPRVTNPKWNAFVIMSDKAFVNVETKEHNR